MEYVSYDYLHALKLTNLLKFKTSTVKSLLTPGHLCKTNTSLRVHSLFTAGERIFLKGQKKI